VAAEEPVGVASAAGVIGWYEYVDLPEWGIAGVRAKIDTGARTSALHVGAVRKQRDGRVQFDVILHRKHQHRRVTVRAHVLRRTRVRSSTGHNRIRYVVPARVRLGGVEKTIEVSLVCRDKMLFRMLLGRSAFSGDFLIDASRQCVLGVPRERAGRRRRTPRLARRAEP
jgi:hypothetical protein